MEIKKMTIDDYEDVYKLWLKTPGMGLNNIDDSKEGIDKFLKRNPNTCFIAKIKDKVVGVILCGHDGRRGYIYHTAVDINNRKKGIGELLVNYALDALKTEGINKVALVVFSKNDVGNSFWENRGFIIRKDIKYRNKELVELERNDT